MVQTLWHWLLQDTTGDAASRIEPLRGLVISSKGAHAHQAGHLCDGRRPSRSGGDRLTGQDVEEAIVGLSDRP